eukprot:COSAG01_NODE_1689_length_9488_cov_5.759825_13_plen_41_part_00
MKHTVHETVVFRPSIDEDTDGLLVCIVHVHVVYLLRYIVQ